MMSKLPLARTTLLSLLIVTSFTACVVLVAKSPKELVSGYKQSASIPLKAGLVLSDELRAAKFERTPLDTTFRILIGEGLVKNSESLIRELFADVVVGWKKEDFNQNNIDVIVVPIIVSVEHTSATSIFSERILTIILEWKFYDSHGNLIWVGTAEGEGVGGTGSILSWKDLTETRLKYALNTLFKNSHEAISNAQEIRDLAK